MSLQTIIGEIQSEVREVSGVRQAPDYPPEKLSVYPFAVCRAAEGNWRVGPPGVLHGIHSIILEVHVARKDMPRDIETVNALSKSIPQAILSAYVDSTKMTSIEVLQRISYSFGRLDWMSIETVGYRFMLEGIKTQEAL